MSDRRAAAYTAYGQLRTEGHYLVEKLRPLLAGRPDARRLLDRFAREAMRIDAELWEQPDYPQGERRAS